ncbi:hypothetical protein [Xanthobacter agilis]|uniref:Uncharacterized protein n=1 Tax=Xanthobacter agilis TaxID=47492 RepID=A0ABU0LBW5_XANAG|nr:hypothetical protein [Xanthobacter agilis]MDQ0504639.1 hypothetical protein [Xanthobacter agilis]
MSAPSDSIEIRLERISQLFNMLDPFPFRERDLDADAEEFIVGWARELPSRQPISIVIHLPADEAAQPEARGVGDAIHNFFRDRAEAVSRELRELFRIGRHMLVIGGAVLAACLFLARMASDALGGGTFRSFVVESLVILGWVANSRPLEIFLYDWWPLVRRRDLLRRLGEAQVTIIAVPPAPV